MIEKGKNTQFFVKSSGRDLVVEASTVQERDDWIVVLKELVILAQSLNLVDENPHSSWNAISRPLSGLFRIETSPMEKKMAFMAEKLEKMYPNKQDESRSFSGFLLIFL
jgi:hypothetical protein